MNSAKIKSLLMLTTLGFACSFLSGCADPTSLLLSAVFSNQNKSDNKSPPKLICTDGVAKIEKNQDAGIVGGKTLDKNSWLARGVVLITQTYNDPKDGEVTTMCTGTLIDENMVLTAAHCVDQAKYSYQTKVNVYFTNQPECDVASGKLAGATRGVSAMRIHENWRAKNDPNKNKFQKVRGDLALLRLEQKAPAEFTPLKLAGTFVPMDHNVILAGYGQTNVDYNGAYSLDNEGILLRLGQTSPASASIRGAIIDYLRNETRIEESRALTADEATFADNEATNESLFVDQTAGQGVCAGDSGGPALMKNKNGTYVVTGVASFVINPVNAKYLCGYAASHTSVSFHKAWLEKTFKEIRNTSSKKMSLFE